MLACLARYAREAIHEEGPVALEHDLPLEEYHRAGREITNGNPEVYKSLYSRRGDVTLANPFGPPARGWSDVSATLDRAAANYRDGEVVGFENVSTVMTSDLAYTVEVESYRARVGGADEIAPVAVRVTTIFRPEEGVWKVVHRHADPITAPRPPESVVRSPGIELQPTDSTMCKVGSWVDDHLLHGGPPTRPGDKRACRSRRRL
jgi:ketosteroid isomerase-like protein